MAITNDLSKGIIFRDDAESVPPISWPTSKLDGYMMFTGGTQVFGDMSNPTNGCLVSQGELGAPAPRLGTKCYRFHIEQQFGASQYCRAELYWGNGDSEITGAQYYALSMYLPLDWGFDTRPIGLGYDFKFPNAQGPANLNLKLINDEFNITLQYPQGAQELYYKIGKVKLGEWIDWIIRFKRSTGSDGIIEVYRNKVKVLTINGPNSPAAESYCLFGPYKWQYQSPDGEGEGQGTYNGPITVFYDEIRIGNASATIDSISPDGGVIDPPVDPEQPDVEKKMINCGGGSIGAWEADKNFSGGSTYAISSSTPIDGTSDDKIYTTERWGNLTYSIPLGNGDYDVKLHFAEIFWNAIDKRQFNVNLQGSSQSVRVLSNFDIFKEAGGKNKAVVKAFKATVSNGTLKIIFSSVKDNAKISAIEIIKRPPVEPPPVDTNVYIRTVAEGSKIINGAARKTAIITYENGAVQTIEKL